MNKFTKLLSIFAIAGAVTTGAAFGIAGCSKKSEETEHTHTAGTAWSSDETNHWNVCTADDGEKMNVAVHADSNSDGKCDVCGYQMTTTPTHTHTAGTAWLSDETNHWNVCTANDGEKMNVAAHADSDSDGKCDVCGYQMTTTPVDDGKLTVADTTAGLTIEGVTDSYTLSSTLTSATISTSGIKVYLTNSDESKGEEVPAANYDIALYDGLTKIELTSAITKDGTYTLEVTLKNAKTASGTAINDGDIYGQISITVSNPVASVALKDGTVATQVQSYTDTMTSKWAYVATKANGETEDIDASKVTLGHIDTVTTGTRTVYASYGDWTGEISYTITEDSTKVEQSYLLQFNNWTDEQKTAVKISTDDSPVEISDVYTVVAGKGEIATGSDTKGDGLYFNSRLKFGGKSAAKETEKQRYIKITAPTAGKLTIYAYTNSVQSGGVEGGVNTERKVGVYKTRTYDGSGSTAAAYSDPVSDSQSTLNKKISIHEFTLTDGGTYYITADGGDICFCLVRLDSLVDAGDGVTKKKAPAGEETVAKLTVSTATESYKQSIAAGTAFTVNTEEYTFKGIKANNVTGASKGVSEVISATDSSLKYYINGTEVVPGTTILGAEYIGGQTVTVKYGDISATYSINVESAVDGVTGATITAPTDKKAASDTATITINYSDFTIAHEGTAEASTLTKTATIVIKNGETTVATLDSTTTTSAALGKGEYTVEATITISNGTKSADFTATCTLNIGVEGAAYSNVVVDSTIASTLATSITAETTLIDNANGKIVVTASADNVVEVDGNSKSYSTDSKSYTHRIKLKGTGTTTYRSVGITVKAGATIVIYCMSSSKESGSERTVQLLDSTGTASTATATLDGSTLGTVEGSSLHKVTYTVTEAGTYYFCSTSGGLNVYGIEILYS